MKKRICFLFVLLTFLCIMTACGKKDTASQGVTYHVYYLDAEGNGLVSEDYTATAPAGDTVSTIDELFDQLQGRGKDGKFQSPLEADLEISDFQIKETQLSVYFSAIYNNRSGLDEILSRAAIVKTLCQVQGVEYVEFYVEDQPLMLSGSAVGLMNVESFVDDLNPDYTDQSKQVTLYFSNADGDKLQEITTEVTYNAMEPLAQLLVEKLIAGPDEIEKLDVTDIVATIPSGTKLNSLTIRDNICYVDLSEEFNSLVPNVKSDVIVYSVVNTLCELPNVTKVQITIDGEQQQVYGDTEDFNTPFERNLNMIQGGAGLQG